MDSKRNRTRLFILISILLICLAVFYVDFSRRSLNRRIEEANRFLYEQTRYLPRSSSFGTDKEFLAEWLVKLNEYGLEAFQYDELYRIMIIVTGLSMDGARIILFARKGGEYYIHKKIYSPGTYTEYGNGKNAKVLGPPLEDSTQILSRADWDQFLQLLTINNFWDLPSDNMNECYDCIFYFIEGKKDNKYHIVGSESYEEIFRHVYKWLKNEKFIE